LSQRRQSSKQQCCASANREAARHDVPNFSNRKSGQLVCHVVGFDSLSHSPIISLDMPPVQSKAHGVHRNTQRTAGFVRIQMMSGKRY
jgi:hypothetical protein